MSDYELAADLFRSIIWPASILVLVLLLRRPLGEIVQSLRFKDFEIALDRQISEAESKSRGIGVGAEDSLLDEEMLKRIDISPRSAILESWLAVEQQLVETAQAQGISVNPRGSGLGRSALRELHSSGTITAELAEMIGELRHVRNQAAHELTVDFYPDAARRYVSLASRISSELSEHH